MGFIEKPQFYNHTAKILLKSRLFIILLLITLCLIFCRGSLFELDKVLKTGDPAPNIILSDMDGKLFNLRKTTNTGYILISFSATYCKPCKEEIPEFINMQKSLEKDKLKIYLIFIDSDISQIKSFISDNKIDLTVLHDKYKLVSDKYGIRGLPASFLINKDGIIIYTAKGYKKQNIEEIKQKIK